MKYGFVIDNRKCIGCHVCTTACKSEHDVAIGVNRTWVKQVEKGEFPNTRRLFSVMRCNHCTDAPCVEICPTEALFFREDGIVDFNNDRCIACKSCMQACPYDALYIDPKTETAAKCNYCAHRVDVGLEPACVNVCPEHAIISGDMEDTESEIFQLLSTQPVSVRKPEKGTSPNLFYINGDEASLDPTSTAKDGSYLWNSQVSGVGHFAKASEKLAFSNGDVLEALVKANNLEATAGEIAKKGPAKSVDLLMNKPRRVYDTPDKGVLWGWEVSAYVMTKAISAGAVLVLFLGWVLGFGELTNTLEWWSIGLALVFLTATGALLVMDLDQPKRFLYVLLRPHWSSWLVKGGYAITVFGGLLTLWGAAIWLELTAVKTAIIWTTAIMAIIVAIYTAFLFAQAKGRDFWQSPTLPLHMIIHSFMAGSSAFLIVGLFTELGEAWTGFMQYVLLGSIALNLLTILTELTITHPTKDAKTVVEMIVKGQYSNLFWGGVVVFGNLLPFALLMFGGAMGSMLLPVIGIIVLIGIYFTEHIWIEAPQRISLT
jgi:Fe-S-cluster-containing dehydrogenase component/formate-dependent nitrite reductase membrane component NrfD